MVVGNYGYRKTIIWTDITKEMLDSFTTFFLLLYRPDKTTVKKVLTQADRDNSGNYTWLIEKTDLTVSGIYKYQGVGVSGTSQIASEYSKFRVADLLFNPA